MLRVPDQNGISQACYIVEIPFWSRILNMVLRIMFAGVLAEFKLLVDEGCGQVGWH